MWRLPLWTAKVRPTKSGVMVERRDQVLIAGGRHPVTPWGQPTRGYKTRNNKRTQKMIVRDRRVK